ncbi:uncharacterized protein TNCV_2844731 [Trichonephila clavipes]|nr:uncharacterized protein TNCV_2844731 [Trichonephila clavipes]
MVFLNEVLTELLNCIPSASIQRLWLSMMGLQCISVLLYVIGWTLHTPDVRSDVRIMFYDLHVHQILHRWIFLWSHFKELVYPDIVTTQMEVARLHAACTSVDPAVLRHVMTAIPRRA